MPGEVPRTRKSTSSVGALAVVHRDLETAFHFLGVVGAEPVGDFGPLRVARVEFFVGEFTRIRPAPRLGGETFQHARPAALGVIVAVGMQAGIDVGDGAPCADEIGSWGLFELGGERAAKLTASAAAAFEPEARGKLAGGDNHRNTNTSGMRPCRGVGKHHRPRKYG